MLQSETLILCSDMQDDERSCNKQLFRASKVKFLFVDPTVENFQIV